MADYPPYMNAYGNVTKVLNKIKQAKTPDRFTQDYLSTNLGVSGGSAMPFIPLAKRLGLLASDGTPTGLYKRFRNPPESKAAMADAIKKGYADLYNRNEYAHKLDRAGLEGLVMEATGLEQNSKTLNAICSTFEALKSFADFDGKPSTGDSGVPPEPSGDGSTDVLTNELNLSYTIYLNLPKTDDIAVFNAIFKSLKENLLSK